MKIRKSVTDFSELMEDKLQDKDVDFGKTGWLKPNCDVEFLIKRLKEDVQELESAYNECNPLHLSEETVDVANFAMMINDRIRNKQKYLGL